MDLLRRELSRDEKEEKLGRRRSKETAFISRGPGALDADGRTGLAKPRRGDVRTGLGEPNQGDEMVRTGQG